MTGALMLLFYPPRVEGYTPDGDRVSGAGFWAELAQSDSERRNNLRRYALRKNLYRVAVMLLLVGFCLQAIDLLTG